MSSSNDNVTSSNSSTSSERLLGRVKWFNSKAGYGFISITDGQRAGTDIFVHHSAINVENQQYRYLVQGEYVEFSILDTPNGNHDCQAASVCGIKSGKLMCETRREFKIARNNYKTQTPTRETRTEQIRSEIPMPFQQRRDKYQRNNSSASASRVNSNSQNQENRNATNNDVNKNWTLVSKSQKPQAENRPRRGRPSKVSQ